MLYLCAEECPAVLVLKNQVTHLKSVIDVIYPQLSKLDSTFEDSEAMGISAQRAHGELEALHALLCECTSNDSMSKHLCNFADSSATICHTYYSLIEIAIIYSLDVKLNSLGNRWSIFRLQLADWKAALETLESISESLRNDPRHSKTSLDQVEDARKKVALQYPEPDILQRTHAVDLYKFHQFNESKSDADDDADICVASGESNFAILSTSGGGVPVCCKTVTAASLKKGSKSLKEIADLYLLTDSTASPFVGTMLKVCFSGTESISMVYALPPIGNLTSMLTAFQKARKRAVGEPGSPEAWLAEHHRVEGKYSVMSDVVAGLAFLHSKGIVHGRLKPSNVLILDNYRARVSDFGMAPFLKPSSRVTSWLEAGRAARTARQPPLDSSSVPFTDLPIGEGGIRWLSPELLFIPPVGDANISTALASQCDVMNPDYGCDKYSAAMVMYYTIFEKTPFYNIIWNEGVYSVLVNGDRPSVDTSIPDCREEELFAPLFDSMERAWHPCLDQRINMSALSEEIAKNHQEVFFAIESRVLDQMTGKLEEIKAQPVELQAKISKNMEKIVKGEDAMRKKEVELENALNGKQRKEFTAQLEKGRSRLDSFIADTNELKSQLRDLESEIKATKKSIKAQTEKRYGGAEHILRHRMAHKETTAMDILIKKYKGSSSKADIDDALSSAGDGGAGGTGLPAANSKHALQSFFFNCGDRSKSFTEEMLEYRNNCNGGTEYEIIDEELMDLSTFACSVFEEVAMTEEDIPRFSKSAVFPIPGSGGTADVRRNSVVSGLATAGFPAPLLREKSEFDLRSENSDQSDISSRSKGTIASAAPSATVSISSWKRREEASSPTENSEEDIFKADTDKSDLKGQPDAVGGTGLIKLEGDDVKYLAAYRGRAIEAVGLIKADRGIDPAIIANLIESGETPAHIAASLGHVEVLRNLIENEKSKADGAALCEAVTVSTGQNVLHAACIGGSVRTVQYLVESIDNLSPEDSGTMYIIRPLV